MAKARSSYTPAEIDPERMYSLSRLREFGFGYRQVKDYREAGYPIHNAGRIGYIIGRDLIAFVRESSAAATGAA